ncbi:hypothetical protein M0R72_14230 [Candidatus Pacearchaeota archaeon]|jgi:hypothetical protein|nr:hypothetical protein [Candidatus Pacearchaeota archaeon]
MAAELESQPTWQDYDPEDWRNHPDPEENDEALDDDEEGDWPSELEIILGFDSADLDL